MCVNDPRLEPLLFRSEHAEQDGIIRADAFCPTSGCA